MFSPTFKWAPCLGSLQVIHDSRILKVGSLVVLEFFMVDEDQHEEIIQDSTKIVTHAACLIDPEYRPSYITLPVDTSESKSAEKVTPASCQKTKDKLKEEDLSTSSDESHSPISPFRSRNSMRRKLFETFASIDDVEFKRLMALFTSDLYA